MFRNRLAVVGLAAAILLLAPAAEAAPFVSVGVGPGGVHVGVGRGIYYPGYYSYYPGYYSAVRPLYYPGYYPRYYYGAGINPCIYSPPIYSPVYLPPVPTATFSYGPA